MGSRDVAIDPCKDTDEFPFSIAAGAQRPPVFKTLNLQFPLTYCKVYLLCRPNFKLVGVVSQTRSNILTCASVWLRHGSEPTGLIDLWGPEMVVEFIWNRSKQQLSKIRKGLYKSTS